MLGSKSNQSNTSLSALARGETKSNTNRGIQPNNNNFKKRKNRPWCDHCRKTNRNKESYYSANQPIKSLPIVPCKIAATVKEK